MAVIDQLTGFATSVGGSEYARPDGRRRSLHGFADDYSPSERFPARFRTDRVAMSVALQIGHSRC